MCKSYAICHRAAPHKNHICLNSTTACPEAEFCDEIQTKVLLAVHSHLYSFAIRYLFLQTPLNLFQFFQCVNIHCKGERRKT